MLEFKATLLSVFTPESVLHLLGGAPVEQSFGLQSVNSPISFGGNSTVSPWTPLYSPTKNSLNPLFVKLVSFYLNAVVLLFVLYQFMKLWMKKSFSSSPTGFSQIVKVFLVGLQAILYFTLAQLSHEPTLNFYGASLLVILFPLHYIEPKKSLIPLASVLVYWTLNFEITLVVLFQDVFSSHVIYNKNPASLVVEVLIFVNNLYIAILEMAFFKTQLDTTNVKPLDTINLFSYLTFSWIEPLIKHIYKTEDVTKKDLPEIADELVCDVTLGSLSKNWNVRVQNAQLQNKNAKRGWFRKEPKKVIPSIFKAVFGSVWWYFVLSLAYEMVDTVLLFCQPFLLRELIFFFTKSNSNETSPPVIIGIFIAVVMYSLSITKFICFNQGFTYQFKIVYFIESGLTSLVYRKALKLTPESRKNKSTGDIINHITVDTETIKWFSSSIQDFFSAPAKVVISMIALYRLLGAATWGGILTAVILIPGISKISAAIYPLYTELMEFKDQRTSLTNEILTSIKSIKLYSWEAPMLKKLDVIRNDKELKKVERIGIFNAFATFIWSCVPFIVSCATYTTFAVIYDVPLTPDLVFPALTLFDLLTDAILMLPHFISSTIEAIASFKRIRDFLLLDEISDDQNGLIRRSSDLDSNSDFAVEIKNATFLWSSKESTTEFKDEEEQVEASKDKSNSALKDINFEASYGELTCVVGRVGSGKSTLIKSILGELPISITGYSDDNDVARPSVKINGSIAYCAQSPWILNATIKENILFGFKHDPEFYKRTVDACELLSDFSSLPDGDKTVVGEKGISLSGGQKARISLARAVYSRADIYLLDDILSAVDSHVGKNIIKNVLSKNGIIGTKTKILATNSVTVLHDASKIFLLKNGSIAESGNFEEVTSRKSDLATLIEEFGSKKDEGEPLSIVTSEEHAESVTGSSDEVAEFTALEAKAIEVAHEVEVFQRRASVASYSHVYEFNDEGDPDVKRTGLTVETTEKGRVKFSHLKEYFMACNYKYVIIYIILTLGTVVTGVGEKYILTYWSQQNEAQGKTVNAKLFLTLYASCGFIGGALVLISAFIVWTLCIIKGAAYFHNKLARAVLRSPMSFFETTPIGRILNRFTDDVSCLDTELPWIYIYFLTLTLSGLSTFVVIVYTLPPMLIVILGLLVFYNHFRLYFIPASRQLARLSKTTKSPILSTIQEAINGVDTIKAYDQGSRFNYKSLQVIDTNILVGVVTQACRRWLSIRLQFISATIMFGTAMMAIGTLFTKKPLNSAMLGFIMTFALNVTSILNAIIRLWAEVESKSVAIERLAEYFALKPEAEMVIEATKPPADWPQRGEISFKNYSTKYRENLDPVLREIDFTVKSQEKIGIVGRTGAGKSSLTLALFRIIESTGGHIEIDGVNTSDIGLFDLRHKLNIIPQEAHTFKAPVRENLDPFNNYTDEQLWHVLDLAHLKSHVESMKTEPTEKEKENSKDPDSLPTLVGLDAKIEEGGSNLSAGQKQLLCLARALLNESCKILILDEATASVDVQTDKIIQETIRSQFKDKTILTIAHRLDTIMDSDRVLVLDKGQVAEFDTPENLLKNKDGIFHSLCEQGGYLKK